MVSKRRETGYVTVVRDMDRTCYICDKESKVCVESGQKFKALDEFCLTCDLDGLKKTVRACVRDKAKFKLLLLPAKKDAVLAVMQGVLNDEDKEAAETAAKHPAVTESPAAPVSPVVPVEVKS